MKTTELVKAAEELNELFGLDPEIDLEGKPVKLTRQIKEAMLLLQTDDDITDATAKVLREVDLTDEDIEEFIEKEKFVRKEKFGLLSALEKLGIWINTEEETEEAEEAEKTEDNEPGEVSLEEGIEAATKLSELKTLVKVDARLKDLRSVMTRYKTIDELKKAILCVLETGVLPVMKKEKEEPAEKKEKATPALKTEKKEKKGSSTTYEQSTENKSKEDYVIEAIKECCKSGADLSTITEKANEIFEKTELGKKQFIGRQRIATTLYGLVVFDVLDLQNGKYIFV